MVTVEQARPQAVRITAYARNGEYALEDDGTPGWRPVAVELAPMVRLERSGKGQLLLYRGYLSFGMGLVAALKLGWCHILEQSEQSTQAR